MLQEGRPEQRNLNDAAALAAKVAAKQAKMSTEDQTGANGSAPVVRKKVVNSGGPNLDDLLSAGLSKKK